MIGELDRKVEEIAAYLARKLGYGDRASLSPAARATIDDETEDAIDAWLEAAADDVMPIAHAHDGELQRLLREYQEIAERIIDKRDEQAANDRSERGSSKGMLN